MGWLDGLWPRPTSANPTGLGAQILQGLVVAHALGAQLSTCHGRSSLCRLCLGRVVVVLAQALPLQLDALAKILGRLGAPKAAEAWMQNTSMQNGTTVSDARTSLPQADLLQTTNSRSSRRWAEWKTEEADHSPYLRTR